MVLKRCFRSCYIESSQEGGGGGDGTVCVNRTSLYHNDSRFVKLVPTLLEKVAHCLASTSGISTRRHIAFFIASTIL